MSAIGGKNTCTLEASSGSSFAKGHLISKCPFVVKVHIFWEGHKILRNLHLTFVLCSASQKQGGDFAKFYGHLRIYEL